MTPGGLVVRLVAIALLTFGEAVTMWTNAARSLVLPPMLVGDFTFERPSNFIGGGDVLSDRTANDGIW